MSTFGGFMPEFPDIRGSFSMLWRCQDTDELVDFFRPIPDRRPPLACFLSHVHSDHLAGLETLKSPLSVFLSCSPTGTDKIAFTALRQQRKSFYASKDTRIV